MACKMYVMDVILDETACDAVRPRYYVCDVESLDRPASGSREGDICYCKDTRKTYTWTSQAAWAQTGGSGSSGSGAKATYIPLIHHFTTLELTTSANALWKIPAATTYGQAGVLLDMSKLGTPNSATLAIVYTNTATSGVNQLGLVLSNSPVAAGTTVVPVTSSIVTTVNSSTYPQLIEQSILIAELGTAKKWAQLALNLVTNSVGPNVFAADLILYY